LAEPASDPKDTSRRRRPRVDIRCSQELKSDFNKLYHRWAEGKGDVSMEAFLRFLVDRGNQSLVVMGYRPGAFRP
jgi:hypothetical protein